MIFQTPNKALIVSQANHRISLQIQRASILAAVHVVESNKTPLIDSMLSAIRMISSLGSCLIT